MSWTIEASNLTIIPKSIEFVFLIMRDTDAQLLLYTQCSIMIHLSKH